MIRDALLQAVSAFVGTLGFAILIRAPRRAMAVASLNGTMAYMLYWVLGRLGFSEPAAVFVGSLFGALMALLCARRMQMISTVFLALSIVAFVPGLGLYRCMQLLGAGDTHAGAQQGVAAMMSIAMIALGQGVGSFVFRALRKKPSAAAKG